MEIKNLSFWNEYVNLLSEVDSRPKNAYIKIKCKKGKEYEAFCREVAVRSLEPFSDVQNPLFGSPDRIITNEYGNNETSQSFLERHPNFKNDLNNSLNIDTSKIYDYNL